MYDKAQEIFPFSFPGRVLVISHWISEGLCNSSVIEEIFNIKDWRKCSPWFFFFFCNFMNPPILERKFSQPEMPLSLKYIFLFKFSNFSGCLKMLQITFCPQIQQEKSLKSELLRLCSWNFWNFPFSVRLSNGKISKLLKFLTWHGFNEFGWNDH